MDLITLAKKLHAFESVDKSDFQRRARILQSLWRQEQDISPGEYRWKTRDGVVRTRPLGSRLPMPWAQESLANYLTDTIKEKVRSEVIDRKNSAGKLYGKPRIFNDLLSSQPLCFNLFGELAHDLPLASILVNDFTGGRFPEVFAISFEHSPGRGDPRYLDDRSAFDVFLLCRTATGAEGFIAIEVKYHENLAGKPGAHKTRYDEVADMMGCFSDDRRLLQADPLQQIWRDHLLAGVTRVVDGYDDGLFVMLSPRDNHHVSDAISDYRQQLTDSSSFESWSLEDVVEKLKTHSDAAWIDAFHYRYLAFENIDRLFSEASGA